MFLHDYSKDCNRLFGLTRNVAANQQARWCETFGEHDVVAEKAIRRPMGDSE